MSDQADPLLAYGQQIRPIACPEVPSEQLFAKRATLAERLAYTGNETATDAADIVALLVRRADGSLRFKDRGEVLRIDSTLAAALASRALEAVGVGGQSEVAAEKKSEANQS